MSQTNSFFYTNRTDSYSFIVSHRMLPKIATIAVYKFMYDFVNFILMSACNGMALVLA